MGPVADLFRILLASLWWAICQSNFGWTHFVPINYYQDDDAMEDLTWFFGKFGNWHHSESQLTIKSPI